MAGTTSPTRKWLMQAPRPSKVRIHVAGDAVREITPSSHMTWAKLANTIDALNPSILEALGKDGELLRARNLEQVAEQGEPQEPAGEGDPLEHVEGETELESFARLIAAAHQSSSERAFQFVEVAFRSMVEMHNLNVKQLSAMQQSVEGVHKIWRRAYEQNVAQGGGEEGDENGAVAAGGGLLMQMLAQFANAQAMANPPPAAHTNGAAKPAKGE